MTIYEGEARRGDGTGGWVNLPFETQKEEGRRLDQELEDLVSTLTPTHHGNQDKPQTTASCRVMGGALDFQPNLGLNCTWASAQRLTVVQRITVSGTQVPRLYTERAVWMCWKEPFPAGSYCDL